MNIRVEYLIDEIKKKLKNKLEGEIWNYFRLKDELYPMVLHSFIQLIRTSNLELKLILHHWTYTTDVTQVMLHNWCKILHL